MTVWWTAGATLPSLPRQQQSGPDPRAQSPGLQAPNPPLSQNLSTPQHPTSGAPLHLQEPQPTFAPAPVPGTILQAQSIYDSPPGYLRPGHPPLSPIIEPSVTPSATSSPGVALPPIHDSSSEAAESPASSSMSQGQHTQRSPGSGPTQPVAPGKRPWFTLGSPGRPEGPQGSAEPSSRRFVRAPSRDIDQGGVSGMETIYATPQFSPSSTPGVQTPLSSGMQTPPRAPSQGQQLPQQQLQGYPPIPYHPNERMPRNVRNLPPGEPLTDFEDGMIPALLNS